MDIVLITIMGEKYERYRIATIVTDPCKANGTFHGLDFLGKLNPWFSRSEPGPEWFPETHLNGMKLFLVTNSLVGSAQLVWTGLPGWLDDCFVDGWWNEKNRLLLVRLFRKILTKSFHGTDWLPGWLDSLVHWLDELSAEHKKTEKDVVEF